MGAQNGIRRCCRAMPSTGETALAVTAAAAAGVAIGALAVLAARRQQADAAARSAALAAASNWELPPHARSAMPMQALTAPCPAPGYAPAAPYQHYGAPVSGTLLHGHEQEPARQQHQRQVDSEFENTVPSMEDLVRLRERNDAADLRVQPSEVLEMLSAGNIRFWTGNSSRPELNTMQRRAEIWQSYPKVAIIGCSDSRVPPEIIFDLALGDVFVIRVAGNAYGTGVAGSVHYAVTHLHVKVVMVLGHEGCGVLRHSQQSLDELDSEPEELSAWFKMVRRGICLETSAVASISDTRARDREAVIRNVRHQVKVIKSRPVMAKRVATGELIVVGAFYEKRSGMVDFIRGENDVLQSASGDRPGGRSSPITEEEIVICNTPRR